MSGHADLMLGYVTTRDADAAQALRTWRRVRRAPSPARSRPGSRTARSPTLALRLERGCDNALAIARLLAARDDVEGVRYPGLPRRPRTRGGAAPDARLRNGRLVRARQRGARRALPGGARLVTDATSFGSVHTTAERRARWGGDAVPEGFIRLSAG